MEEVCLTAEKFAISLVIQVKNLRKRLLKPRSQEGTGTRDINMDVISRAGIKKTLKEINLGRGNPGVSTLACRKASRGKRHIRIRWKEIQEILIQRKEFPSVVSWVS